MRKSIYWIIRALIVILVFAIVSHVIASVLFDGPITFSFTLENTTDDIVSCLNKKTSLLRTNFEYVGYSTHDINSPDTPISFFWYTSPLPVYIAVGTDTYVLCLVHFDRVRNEFDYVNTYIGSSRAIDSVTRRYSYSLERVD